MPKKPAATKRGEAPSTLVAALAVVGLVILTLADMSNGDTTSAPSMVYWGLIGTMFGAKYESIRDWLGGRK